MKAAESGKNLLELASADKSISECLEKFSKEELGLLQHPENYSGLAAPRTELVCGFWKKRFSL